MFVYNNLLFNMHSMNITLIGSDSVSEIYDLELKLFMPKVQIWSSKIVVFYVLFVCKCVLPPGDNPNAVNKYIIYIKCVLLLLSLR